VFIIKQARHALVDVCEDQLRQSMQPRALIPNGRLVEKIKEILAVRAIIVIYSNSFQMFAQHPTRLGVTRNFKDCHGRLLF
jgi:hypothetical protein